MLRFAKRKPWRVGLVLFLFGGTWGLVADGRSLGGLLAPLDGDWKEIEIRVTSSTHARSFISAIPTELQPLKTVVAASIPLDAAVGEAWQGPPGSMGAFPESGPVLANRTTMTTTWTIKFDPVVTVAPKETFSIQWRSGVEPEGHLKSRHLVEPWRTRKLGTIDPEPCGEGVSVLFELSSRSNDHIALKGSKMGTLEIPRAVDSYANFSIPRFSGLGHTVFAGIPGRPEGDLRLLELGEIYKGIPDCQITPNWGGIGIRFDLTALKRLPLPGGSGVGITRLGEEVAALVWTFSLWVLAVLGGVAITPHLFARVMRHHSARVESEASTEKVVELIPLARGQSLITLTDTTRIGKQIHQADHEQALPRK